MKKIYQVIQTHLVVLLLIALAFPFQAQQTYTFTTAGATGSVGPTQTQINTAYLGTNLQGSVVCTSGIQSFTVPGNGSYRIEAYGGQGGSSTGGANTGTIGGYGAGVIGDFTLTGGQVLRILVGHVGGTEAYGGGGGGGSFVADNLNNPIIVAGGGGGASGYVGNTRGIWVGGCGLTSTSGGTSNVTVGAYGFAAPGSGGGPVAMGGTGGFGGGGAVSSGGGGFYNIGGAGTYATPGLGFLQGGTGGTASGGIGLNWGGFGGGGGGQTGTGYGGGGGGYSGGGAGNFDGTTQGAGGGGGSYNSGSNQTSTICINPGNGRVIIRELCSIKITSSGSNSVAPVICSGTSLTLTTNAVSPFTWFNGNNTSNSVVVSPTANATYSIVGTSTAACTAQAFITVTVSSGIPVLSISNPSSNICLGRTVSLTATGAVSYSWTGGISNGQTFTPSATQGYTVTGYNGCGNSTASTTITVSQLPVTTAASPTIVCTGLPATLTAVSSVTGYTWQPAAQYVGTITVAPMANTIYTVTASDGTCSGTQTVAVATKITPTITASASSSAICPGGSVVLTASGASTYNWMPGNLSGSSITVSPTSSILYSVDGTNSVNCTASANQAIIVNPSPTVNITANKLLVCTGAPVILSASGANTYVWTNGPSTAGYTVNPTGPTVYTVTGTQTGNICTSTKTIAISVIVPNVSVSSNTAVCPGGSATVTASGASTYTWNGIPMGANGSFPVSPVATTIYTVVANTVSNSVNCPVSKTVEVSVNPTPTITVVPTKSVICKGNTNTLTASGAVTYTWVSIGTGSSSIVIKPNNTTIYTVYGTDANGCDGTQLFSAQVSPCTGIAKLTGNDQVISIYPNPSTTEFVISYYAAISLRIVNELGQEVKKIELTAQNEYRYSVSGLAAGVYFVLGENTNGQVNQKVIITK